MSGLVLEHLASPIHFFREVERVLRMEGRSVVSTMHPAMFRRGSQARFTDPDSGEVISPGSYSHGVDTFRNAAVAAGLRLVSETENAPTAQFALRYPRAEKYIDYPMLLVLTLEKIA